MNPMESWGFRLQGGRDFRQQLSVKKVSPGSPADGRIHAGDAIASINGYDASQLTHSQASQMIRNAGQVLQLSLDKGVYKSFKPTGKVKFSPAMASSHTMNTAGGMHGGMVYNRY